MTFTDSVNGLICGYEMVVKLGIKLPMITEKDPDQIRNILADVVTMFVNNKNKINQDDMTQMMPCFAMVCIIIKDYDYAKYVMLQSN